MARGYDSRDPVEVERDNLKDLLRSLEWSGADEGPSDLGIELIDICPSCGGVDPRWQEMGQDSGGATLMDYYEEGDFGHTEDCKLAAAIR
jgi:hypothetical protein